MTNLKSLIYIVPVALLLVLAAWYFGNSPEAYVLPDQSSGAKAEELIQQPPAEKLYGIPVSSYNIIRGKVLKDQTLAHVLFPHGVSANLLHKISLLPDSLLDERKIKPGNAYALFFSKDTILTYFVYEKDPLNYVAVQLTADPLQASGGQKEIEHRLTYAKGTIETSLWEAMKESESNPMLAVELSEIFAWSIDFFGIQQGDQYRVIYEESYVDSASIGIRRILGAWIKHSGTEFWGIPFEQDEVRSFFDERGNSLRKAFLKAPLRFSRISSGFSHSRFHPVLKIRRPHHGVDYAAASGTPVYTVGDGVVTKTGYQSSGGGNYVKIKHNSVYSTTYMHLRSFAKGIRGGTYVKQGDLIGYVGKTGLATGPHLDFRFYKNGSAVNPLKVEAPPVEPIHEENIPAYELKKSLTMTWLKLL